MMSPISVLACLAVSVLCNAPTTVVGQCGSSNAVNISRIEETVYLFEDEVVNVTISVEAVTIPGTFGFKPENDEFFEVEIDDGTDVEFDPADDFPRNVTVILRGKLISISELIITFTPDGSPDVLEVASKTVGVKQVPSVLQAVYIYVIMVWVVLSYLSMGGTMNFKQIWSKLRRPWGVLIGLFCQFIIMPAMTYFIAKLAADGDATTAVGIIIVGTCPGGWLSNVFSVLLDADFVLSVTMTFFSSLLALGMMPLNLFIYTTPFTDGDVRLETPYADLAQQLLILIVPCLVGIAISYKFPKFKTFSEKVMKPIGALLVIIGIALVFAADLYAFITSSPTIWIVGFVTPTFGAFFGMSLARIFGLSIRTAITIALETGIQNALLGRAIVGLFYPQPEADLISRVMLVNVVLTIAEGSLITLVYAGFRYYVCRARCDVLMAANDDEIEKGDDDITKLADDPYIVNGSSGQNGGATMTRDNGTDNRALEMGDYD